MAEAIQKCALHLEQLIADCRNLNQLTKNTFSMLLESNDARIDLGGSEYIMAQHFPKHIYSCGKCI